jgi:hypothetical protein
MTAKELFDLLFEKGFGWVAWGALIFYLFSLIITWLFAKRQNISEIKKTDYESLKIRFELHEKMQNYYKESHEIVKKARECLTALADAIEKKNKETAREYWLDSWAFLFDEYLMHVSIELITYEEFYRKDRRRKLYYINDTILKFLECAVEFNNVMNDENILKFCGMKRYKISRESLNPMIRFVYDNTTVFDKRIRKRMNGYLKDAKVSFMAEADIGQSVSGTCAV